jgi:hypothetical protein
MAGLFLSGWPCVTEVDVPHNDKSLSKAVFRVRVKLQSTPFQPVLVAELPVQEREVPAAVYSGRLGHEGE